MTIVNANEAALGIESFGDDDAPLVLLAGGTTMLTWPDALCERLAADAAALATDLPDHDQATMDRLFAHPMPDWADREAVVQFAAASAEILGDDPVAARAIAARIWDRTPGTAPPVQMANQMGMVVSTLDCKSRWRERLPEIGVPTLVVHGRTSPDPALPSPKPHEVGVGRPDQRHHTRGVWAGH